MGKRDGESLTLSSALLKMRENICSICSIQSILRYGFLSSNTNFLKAENTRKAQNINKMKFPNYRIWTPCQRFRRCETPPSLLTENFETIHRRERKEGIVCIVCRRGRNFSGRGRKEHIAMVRIGKGEECLKLRFSHKLLPCLK